MTLNHGYAGNILFVNLSSGDISTVPTGAYNEKYIGGRGIALKIHWDETPLEISAFDPENHIVFMTGPVCCVPGLAGSRWQISGKSPILNRWSHSNLGGKWGAQLKLAGFDGLVVHGKSKELACLVIDGDKIRIEDASMFKERGAIDVRNELKKSLGDSFSIVAIGPAGENMVHFATITADQDSSGSGGLGGGRGSKNIKAIAVRGERKIAIAHEDQLRLLRKEIKHIKPVAGRWPTMLPVENIKREVCFGCIDGCMRQTYKAEDGSEGKYFCESAIFYEIRAMRFYNQVTEVPFKATKLCDNYGLDTRAIEAMIMWLSRCYKAGILTNENTGLPLSEIGSLDFIETLLFKIAHSQDFGEILARGTLRAAEEIGVNSQELITDYVTKSGEPPVYGARLYLPTALLWALDSRMPIQQLHEISMPVLMWLAREARGGLVAGDLKGESNYMSSEVLRGIARRFWGDETCADFSTPDGAAQTAVKVQDRETAKECLILCDFAYPILHSPTTKNHIGDPSLESRILSTVTGMEIDEQALLKIGERVFNLQRAVFVREGWKGRLEDTVEEFNFNVPLKNEPGNSHCLVPGKDGEPSSRQNATIDPLEFEKMKDEYYRFRGWDISTGLQTQEKLEELDLNEIAEGLII